MVAVTDQEAVPITADTTTPPMHNRIGVVASASLIAGAAIAVAWLWLPLLIVIFGISSIPTVIGFVVAVVVFVYLMRGVAWLERVRSEAVFGMDIRVPPRKMSHYTGFQRWLHQLGLDLVSTRFWKGCAHHFLRMVYDLTAGGLAFVLLAFALLAPAAAIAVHRSDDAGVSFISPALAWPLAFAALAVAVAIVVFGPSLDAAIDRWLLSPSPTAMLQNEVHALATPGLVR